MAIVESFRKWRHYLAYAKAPVQVLTDHLNHRYLATKTKISRREARWMEELAPFSFSIDYREGRKNPADGLSWRPDHVDWSELAVARKQPLEMFLGKFEGKKLPRAVRLVGHA